MIFGEFFEKTGFPMLTFSGSPLNSLETNPSAKALLALSQTYTNPTSQYSIEGVPDILLNPSNITNSPV
jgi:hypothetical protein